MASRTLRDYPKFNELLTLIKSKKLRYVLIIIEYTDADTVYFSILAFFVHLEMEHLLGLRTTDKNRCRDGQHCAVF